MRRDGPELTNTTGELVTADHKVLREENGSRWQHRHAVVVQDFSSYWIQKLPN